MDTKTIILAFFLLVVGSLIGNLLGDRATLKDCATTGHATMVGGGTILCSVEQDFNVK